MSIIFGKITNINSNGVNIALDDEIDLSRVNRYADGKQPTIELKIADGRRITPDQRKKIYGLLNDLSEYTGDNPEYWKAQFKFKVEEIFAIDDFSLSDCSVTTANHMIMVVLEFLLDENIPFKTKWWDSLPDDFPRERMAIMHRRCVICGKPADIAHYNAVGNRSRKNTDHRKFLFMSLCREHHEMQHNLGVKTFIELYHIKPIRLSGNDLVDLGVMNRKRLKELDET